MIRKTINIDFYRIGFLVVSVLFLIFETGIYKPATFYLSLQISNMFGALLFFIYSIAYLTHINSGIDKRTALILDSAFLLSILNFSTVFIFSGMMLFQTILSSVEFFESEIIYTILFAPLIFVIFFGAYFFKEDKRKIAYLLFLLAVIIILVYYFFGIVFQRYQINDEMFISFVDAKLFLQGLNPYSTSISKLLYYNISNGNIASVTLTSNNKMIGILNYPALFLFSSLPFYFLSAATTQNFAGIDLEIETGVWLFLLLMIVALSVEKRYLNRPVYTMIFFITMVILYITSVTIYLMFALLILAYTKLEGKYSWLLLGLCLSIQEELWLPVIFLIAYSFNNYGIRKGFYDLMGALVTFLVINSYFILLDPAAFVNGIFNPVQQLILPSSDATFGYFIAANYTTLLNAFTPIFGLMAALSLILFVHFNEKRLVGILSMLPLLFLSHSVESYYTFFVSFAVLILFMKEEKKTGVNLFGGHLKRNKYQLYFLMMLILALILAIVYYSHSSYVEAFNLAVTNSTLHFDPAKNQTIYTATFDYKNLKNNTVYLRFVGFAMDNPNLNDFGFANYTMINTSTACSDYTCLINTNRIDLDPSNSAYRLYARIHWPDGEPVYAVKLVLYNGQYVYTGGIAYNTSVPGG